jgi:signal transduction histidine kinase
MSPSSLIPCGWWGTDERTRVRIDQIHKAAARARSMTTQLLAFSRKQIVEPHVIDVNAVVDDAARMLGRLVGEHIETNPRIRSDALRVKADPGELVEILINGMRAPSICS